jgi:hypothetical protein
MKHNWNVKKEAKVATMKAQTSSLSSLVFFLEFFKLHPNLGGFMYFEAS